MKDYYGIDAGLVVSIESSEKVKSILLFFAITIIFIYFSNLYFISNGFSNYIVVGIFLSCLCVLFCIFYLLLESINTEIVFNEDHLLYRKIFLVKKVLYSEIKGYQILHFKKEVVYCWSISIIKLSILVQILSHIKEFVICLWRILKILRPSISESKNKILYKNIQKIFPVNSNKNI